VQIEDDIPWLRDLSPAEMRRIVDALYRVHHLLSVITDLQTLLERIIHESKEVARAEACSLILCDGASGELYFHITQGESGDQQALKREVRLQPGEGIAGAAAASRESVNVADVAADPRFYKVADEITQFRTRSLLAVPMVDHERLIGVIEVVNKVDAASFSDVDRRVLEMFASLAATAIANARLIEANLRSERMAAIGQAVAGLSHYTKNIITGMLGSVDLIDQGLERNDIDILRRCWPIFRRSTSRIADFVQDMLAFSKPRAPMYEPCDLKRLIEDAAQSCTGMLALKQVQLDISVSGDDVPIHVDVQGLFRCLLNLLSNAHDAVPDTGGRIVIEARVNAEGTLLVEIGDNGPGIPEKDRRVVFEPFFSTKGSRGTGLGLAVAYKILHEHGGDIVLDRSPEGGALFRISVPGVRSAKIAQESQTQGGTLETGF